METKDNTKMHSIINDSHITAHRYFTQSTHESAKHVDNVKHLLLDSMRVQLSQRCDTEITESPVGKGDVCGSIELYVLSKSDMEYIIEKLLKAGEI